jgi:hypothetical protein
VASSIPPPIAEEKSEREAPIPEGENDTLNTKGGWHKVKSLTKGKQLNYSLVPDKGGGNSLQEKRISTFASPKRLPRQQKNIINY